MIISDGIYYGLPIGAQGFRRLRAATYFAHGGKVGKTPPGTAPDEHFVLIVALPRTPIYGSHPLKYAEHFRRAKSGVLGYYPVRPHWGPEWGENWDWCDSMPAPELAEPTSLVRNMGYLIRPLRGHLPLKRKACGRLIAAPTVHRKPVGAHSMRPPEFAPGALVRKRQARERNRARPNFPPTQAPSGAGRDRTQALLILRAGNVLPTSRGNPRKWGPGKAVLWT